MEKIIQNIPFLRITLALAIGIYLDSLFPIINAQTIIFIIIILGFVVIFINKIYNYHLQIIFGIIINLTLITTGFYFHNNYNRKPAFYEKGSFIATILELPQEKTNSYQTIANIKSVVTGDSVFHTNEKVIIYFSKNDPVNNLQPGDIIAFDSRPQHIKNFGNPYEFDYKRYLERKRIYRQVYLDEKSWINTLKQKNSIQTIAEKTRNKLLSIYQKLPIDKNELEILSALTLGYKRDLDPETKRVFSSAGAMHVLAVSGLHVGIIFWIIIFMFGYLRRQKPGKFIFTTIAIVTLWGYAFITGLSPSVMRAATMFSIFIISEVINRRSNIYNSLLASAFILLIINPNNLFETGFQLSYSAVFGIVYLQPKLRTILNIKITLIRFIWDLFCVSVAAQIATMPFTLYYFSQFPSYFWLSNIIIIPVITILIPLGILLLFVSSIAPIANFIAGIINLIIKSIFFLLSNIEHLPYSVISSSISLAQGILLFLIILAFFLILKSKKIIYMHVALLFLFLMITSFVHQNYTLRNRNELIVYNSPENTTIELIHGKQNYVITENKLAIDDPVTKAIEQTTLKRKLLQPEFFIMSDSILNQNLFLNNGIIYFEGKTILVGNNEIQQQTINPDIIINSKSHSREKPFPEHVEIIITNKSYNNDINNKNQINHYATFDSAFRKIW